MSAARPRALGARVIVALLAAAAPLLVGCGSGASRTTARATVTVAASARTPSPSHAHRANARHASTSSAAPHDATGACRGLSARVAFKRFLAADEAAVAKHKLGAAGAAVAQLSHRTRNTGPATASAAAVLYAILLPPTQRARGYQHCLAALAAARQ
jgi:hypothetical protein